MAPCYYAGRCFRHYATSRLMIILPLLFDAAPPCLSATVFSFTCLLTPPYDTLRLPCHTILFSAAYAASPPRRVYALRHMRCHARARRHSCASAILRHVAAAARLLRHVACGFTFTRAATPFSLCVVTSAVMPCAACQMLILLILRRACSSAAAFFRAMPTYDACYATLHKVGEIGRV